MTPRSAGRGPDAFSERTGYDVTTVRLPTSEALERIRHGEDLPEFDVWHGGGSEMYVEAADEGLLASYRSGESEGIPAAFQDTENRWSGVYSSMLAFCVAPQAVAELGTDIPHTWDDLLDPALKGQISTASPRTSGTAYTAMSLQIDRLGADAGRGYLADLYGQVLQFTRSGTAPAQVVARGEAAVAITFAPYCDAARADGSQVDVVLPDDATEYEVGAVAVLADAPHPEAARDYLDFALSADGQQAGATSGIEQIPTRSDLPDNLAEILADGSLSGDRRLAHRALRTTGRTPGVVLRRGRAVSRIWHRTGQRPPPSSSAVAGAVLVVGWPVLRMLAEAISAVATTTGVVPGLGRTMAVSSALCSHGAP